MYSGPIIGDTPQQGWAAIEPASWRRAGDRPTLQHHGAAGAAAAGVHDVLRHAVLHHAVRCCAEPIVHADCALCAVLRHAMLRHAVLRGAVDCRPGNACDKWQSPIIYRQNTADLIVSAKIILGGKLCGRVNSAVGGLALFSTYRVLVGRLDDFSCSRRQPEKTVQGTSCKKHPLFHHIPLWVSIVSNLRPPGDIYPPGPGRNHRSTTRLVNCTDIFPQ